MRLFLALAALLTLASVATAAPPEGADPSSPIGRWFQSLQAPSGGSCCSLADGRVTSVRVAGDHYEAWIDERFPNVTEARWEPVKAEAVLQRVDNPTGEFVVFWFGGEVRCLVAPAGA